MHPEDPLNQASEGEDAPLDGSGGHAANPAGEPGVSLPAWEHVANFPNRIGRYTIVRKLNDGGMGVVFEATQDNPQRSVALKVLKPGLMAKAYLRRFQTEAQILASLRHDHIAQIFEADIHTDPLTGQAVPFFAMEYVPAASTLTEYAGNHGLAVEERLRLFLDVLSAVGAAHQQGITHRDLKPSNILVDPEGSVKVIDFGVARTERPSGEHSAMTQAGTIIGTLAYMSPEQYEDDVRIVDARSDIYTLGVILHQLLTDAMPYDVSPTDVIRAAEIVRSAKPRALPRLGVARQTDLETILGRALHKDRSHRFATAEAFADDLRQFLDGLPINSRRENTVYVAHRHVGRMLERNRFASILLGIFIGASLTQFVALTWLFQRTPISKWFERGLSESTPARVTSVDNVRMIEWRDGTDFEALAAKLGIVGVKQNDVFARRLFHARLAHRLANSGCLAATWTMMFRSPSPWDEHLVGGFRAMRKAGVPVIMARPQWIHEGAAPDAPPIGVLTSEPGVAFGGATVHKREGLLAVDFTLQRGLSPVIPSIVALSYGAAKLGTNDLVFTHSDDLMRVGIGLAAESPLSWSASRLEVGVQRTLAPPEPDMINGIRLDDRLSELSLQLPSKEARDANAIDFRDALLADDETFRQLVDGRVVFVADVRTAAGDLHSIAGHLVAGAWLQASALETLFQGKTLTHPALSQSLSFTLLASAIGGLIPVAFRRWRSRLAVLALAAITLSIVCGIVYRTLFFVINPAPVLTALILGFVMVSLLYAPRIRRQPVTE